MTDAQPDDIFIDSETLDSLHDPHITRLPPGERIGALRFGLAVTYDGTFGWRSWTSSLVNLLWNHLTMPGLRIVGWDVLEYDLPVICHAMQCSCPNPILDMSAEIQDAIGRHYKLDSIARANLGRGKLMDTYLVIEWLRKGDSVSMTRATEHCHNNVQLVRDLLAFVRRGAPLVLPGREKSRDYAQPAANEETLRLYFNPDGAWVRCETTHGAVINQRTVPARPAVSQH